MMSDYILVLLQFLFCHPKKIGQQKRRMRPYSSFFKPEKFQTLLLFLLRALCL